VGKVVKRGKQLKFCPHQEDSAQNELDGQISFQQKIEKNSFLNHKNDSVR